MTMTTADLGRQTSWATQGDLVTNSRGKLYRVDRILSSVNYLVTDENGKQWKLRREAAYEAPPGAVFSGPSTSARDERKQELAARADEFSVGDVVEMARARDKGQFPGTYLITKRTAPTRFKLVGVGTGVELTSPAHLIKKA